MKGGWDWLAARRWWSLGLALVVIVGGLTLIEVAGVIHRDTAADSILANIFTWTWLMTFLGFGRHHLSFSNPLLRWARDASYPVYILHQTVIIGVAYFVIRQPWSPWSKYGVVLVATIVSCVLMYEVIRRVTPLRFLFGMRPERSPAPRTLSSRTAAS